MGLFSRSSASTAEAAARYLVVGMEVACPQCRNNLFRSGKAQLNTAAMSFLNLDWANPSATTLICSQCAHISWFAVEPTRLE